MNGRFVPHGNASVHIEDRGFQFADGVYEVVTVLDGTFVDIDGHLARLDYSLAQLAIRPPMTEAALRILMRRLVDRNRLADGIIYLQVTRGVAPRDFKFPKRSRSTLVMTTRSMKLPDRARLASGVRVVTAPDIRWARRDIKSVGLLAQVLAKQHAAKSGAFECWMIDPDGFVTEGASSNAWILTADGVLVTRQANNSVLHGITGNTIERLAAELQIPTERRPFTVQEALAAREAFLSSATTFCTPVVAIDGAPVGSGSPGALTLRLAEAYDVYARSRQTEPFAWTH